MDLNPKGLDPLIFPASRGRFARTHGAPAPLEAQTPETLLRPLAAVASFLAPESRKERPPANSPFTKAL